MSPRTSPPQPTDDYPNQSTDASLEVDDTGAGPATPSVPGLLSVGGLFVVYLTALTALGVRRTLSWLRSAVGGRGR